jgi:uncharacterized repeat protein (TIGR01451 family)
MKRLIVLLLAIVMVVLLVTSCTSPELKSELTIPNMISSVGVDPSNPVNQRLTYTITLQNNGLTDVTVRYIEPILSTSFASKAKGNDFKVTVDKTVAPKAYIEISGEILFDTTGMTKEQIAAMEPFFSQVDVNTDKTLSIMPLSTK